MMKRYILPLLMGAALVSCDQYDDLGKAPTVEPLDVKIDLASLIGQIAYGDMVVKLDNYNEGLHREKTFSGAGCTVSGIVPGIYTINVSGKGITEDGEEFMLAGSSTNTAITRPIDLKVEIRGSAKGKLVFSEIYYCGSKFFYFRDQFYEIANNTDEVQYLDGLYFGNTEVIDFDKIRPVWPDPDGEFVYLEKVWKFPGKNGEKNYPLQPGESCVVAQFAANHQLEIYNPNSPVDCSAAEFEFNTNNQNYPDQPAFDMEMVFNDGTTSLPVQYLTAVFGTGYVIFQIPEDEIWDPIVDKTQQTPNLSRPSGTVFAKVPTHYIVDAVEGIRNESYVDAKNLPAVADAGFVTLGDVYLKVGVTRKLASNANGEVLYQDTNNSTDDFEVGVTPVLHRHSKMPAWNHTLAGSSN